MKWNEIEFGSRNEFCSFIPRLIALHVGPNVDQPGEVVLVVVVAESDALASKTVQVILHGRNSLVIG